VGWLGPLRQNNLLTWVMIFFSAIQVAFITNYETPKTTFLQFIYASLKRIIIKKTKKNKKKNKKKQHTHTHTHTRSTTQSNNNCDVVKERKATDEKMLHF
jgi:hypothetical protein